MDFQGRITQRVQEIYTRKGLFFRKLVRRNFRDQPRVFRSFLQILAEYTCGRIDHADMYYQVSRLYSAHPEVIEVFGKCFPQANSTKRVNEHDSTETLRSALKSETEDNSKEKTTYRLASYASDFFQSLCSSGCYPFECEVVASRSSSLPSRSGNSAKPYEAQKKKTAQLRDTALYVTEKKTKWLNEPQAYQHLIKLVNDIDSSSIDTYAIMELASILLEGYPELIESFNLFLPDGYRIVILSDDHGMSTD